MCACHREVRPGPHYACPRCKSRVCHLPTPCPVCNITLVSSPHLARSYHHLFPVPTFQGASTSRPSGAHARVGGAPGAACSAVPSGREGRHHCNRRGRHPLPPIERSVSLIVARPIWRLPCRAHVTPSAGILNNAISEATHLTGAVKGVGGGVAECLNAAAEAACFACRTPLQEAVPAGDAAVRCNVVLRCGRCTQLFCVECDLLIHDALHNCPGCEFASVGSLPAT